MLCPNTDKEVEFCMCGGRHICPACSEISLYDANDNDLNHCRCDEEDTETLVATVESYW